MIKNKKNTSPLDQWDLEGKAFLVVALSLAAFMLPVAIYWIVVQSWSFALYNCAMVLLLLSLASLAYFTHKVRVASIVMTTSLVVGAFLSTLSFGDSSLISIFPLVMIGFYLLPLAIALLTVGIPIAILCYINYHTSNLDGFPIQYAVFAYAAFIATAVRYQSQQFQKMASLDPLTGVGNRRAMSRKLDYVIEQRDINKSNSALLIVDFDHFKMINDKFGHDIGDSILKKVMVMLQDRIRETDSIFRFGGEEFVIVLEKASAKNAHELAEKLRKTIAEAEMAKGHNVTISIGVAELKEHETISEWMKRGDRALFQAKKNGRNQSVLADIENDNITRLMPES